VTLDRLPLFPLGLVLFPGAAVPLHLFEPRYRQMLKDVRAGDNRFGILCGISGVGERQLPAGRIGCVAEVSEVEMLPDGRSNIVVIGRERFALDAFIDDDAPYHVVRAQPVEDVAAGSPVALTVAADEVASNFKRVVRAVNILNDSDDPPPVLPDDPRQLPWTIGAMIDLDLEARQRLLSECSPAARLAAIDAVLRKALPDLEFQAAMHKRA
jgi:Lon protease-like protein